MTDIAELLKPTEAAVVSGVELSIVNHAINRALPPRLIRRGKEKAVPAAACFYIAFYHQSASKLTADERRFAIAEIDKHVEAADGASSFWVSLQRHCQIRHEYLALDLEPFLTQTHERWDRYLAAREAVVSDTAILDGAPVLAGTRIPVHDIGASVSAGLPVSRICQAYPSLSPEQIELASLYARANPLQGRPREGRSFGEAKILSRRVAKRRRLET